MTDWINTKTANEIMDSGVTDRTFRDKFKDIIRTKKTPGGHLRWDKESVKAAAGEDSEVIR